MAFYDLVWYCTAGDQSTTGHYAVAKRPQNAAVTAGQLVRQFTAPAVGSERVFACIIAGTTANVTDATWVLTRGAKTVDGTVTWMEVTGASAVNGDLTDTVNWTAAKAIGAPTLGAIIQRNSGASYQICTTAGTMGAAEPAFSNTAGVTTSESGGAAVWTSLGVVGNFTGGQAPHARLPNACATTWWAAGNTIYVGDNHAESSSAAITISPAASQATMGKIICHNHSGSYPPTSADLATTATISTSSTAGAALSISPSGGAIYFYGLTFLAGVGQSTGANLLTLFPASAFYYFDNCIFKLATTGISGNIALNTINSGAIIWNNCQVSFAAASQVITLGNTAFTWQNTGQVLASGSSVPTNLLNQTNADFSNVILEALDLSQVTSVFTYQSASIGNWVVKDCKLNASATFSTPPNAGQIVQYVRADGAATAYKSARYAYEGTETTETSVTRVGGASDPTGQAQSRKIVTTANSQWLRPFKAEPYAIWNPTTGANVTVTVYGTINAGALPNNDDIWLEVEYLGSSASPLGTIVTTTKANLFAANAAVASDGSTWNGVSFSAWNPQDLVSATISNNGLTVTGTASPSGVRAIEGKTSGKFYFEYTVSTWAQLGTQGGMALPTAVLNAGIGVGATAVARGGTIAVNNVSSGKSLGARAAGDTIGIAVDLGAQLIWYRVAPSGNWNGDAAANPATGANGVSISVLAGALFPCFMPATTAEAATANFGGSAFSGAVPSGFTSGWTATWSPFKLVAVLSAPQPGMAGYLHARVRAAKPSATFYIDPKIVLS